jgi:hypothetical protein
VCASSVRVRLKPLPNQEPAALAVSAHTFEIADAAVRSAVRLAKDLILAAQVAVQAVGPQRVARPAARS